MTQYFNNFNHFGSKQVASISSPVEKLARNTKRKTSKQIRNRYRWYSVLVVVAILPLLAADTFNFPQTVFTAGAEYDQDIYIAKRILSKNFDPIKAIEALDQALASRELKIGGQGIGVPDPNSVAKAPTLPPTQAEPDTGDQTISEPVQPPQKTIITLDELIPKPASPQFTNQIIYPKVRIKAPIILSTLEDLFEKDANGNIDTNRPIEEKEEDIKAGNYESTPIQRLLKDGVVHMASSVLPGEIGNSYVIGHSSNYRQVKSAYNYVFATLTQAKIDDEFTIFDPYGRELKFKVFEVIVIDATQSAEAYKDFGDKRVVTLQASVLVDGKPLKRRLIRGELQI